MKRIVFAVALVCILTATSVTAAPPRDPAPASCTVQALRPFSAQVWDTGKWRRGAPARPVFAAFERRRRCASPSHRAAMSRTWSRDRAAFRAERRRQLHRERWTPYYGCTKLGICKWWAIPAYIVSCESGGDYTPDAGLTFGGAYGLLVSTWQQYGGGRWASQANYAHPWAQDRVARRVWLDLGSSPWSCA